jgi:hypothetical protein
MTLSCFGFPYRLPLSPHEIAGGFIVSLVIGL